MPFTVSEMDVVLNDLRRLAATGTFEELDKHLRGQEKRVLHEGTEPLTHAHLCYLALRTTSDPAKRAMLKLEMLNGYRRVDSTGEEAQLMVDEVKQDIQGLPDGSGKVRCQDYLYTWQLPVFFKKQGLYAEAIELHRQGAASETVSAPDRASNEYLVHFYTVCLALMDGDPADIDNALTDLEAALPVLQDKVKGTNKDQYWGALNGPMHLMQAWLYIGSSKVGSAAWNELLALFLANIEGGGPRNKAWAQLLPVVDNEEALYELARSTKVMDDLKSTVHLLLARMQASKGDIEAAKASYQLVQPVPNGQMIAAVAQRELAALGN